MVARPLAILEDQLLVEKLRQEVNQKTPLGPIDIADVQDRDVAGALFVPNNHSFNELAKMDSDIDVVVGRRGSGKTSLLRCYQYQKYLHQDCDGHQKLQDFSFDEYRYVFDITTWDVYEKMQSIAQGTTGELRPIESISDDWRHLLGEHFLANFSYSYPDKGDHDLKTIHEYLATPETTARRDAYRAIWGRPVWEYVASNILGTRSATKKSPSLDDALLAGERMLTRRQQKGTLLIDSLDDYVLGNGRAERTIGALMRAIRKLNRHMTRIKIKLALPAEIFPEIERNSANALKETLYRETISWTSIELFKVAAYRYSLFLSLWEKDYYETNLAHFDITDRQGVNNFWKTVFRVDYINSYGTPEHPMTYLLRHTQLLPRQILALLERLILAAHVKPGSFRDFSAASILATLQRIEPTIAREVLGAYGHIFRDAEYLARSILGNFPTIFTFDQFEDRWKKFGRTAMTTRNPLIELPEVIEMFIRIGIFGLVDQPPDGHSIHDGKTERYIEASFAYSAESNKGRSELSPVNVGPGDMLCIHPIFSQIFRCGKNAYGKAILPHRGIEHLG
jgi:hypothetical protein